MTQSTALVVTFGVAAFLLTVATVSTRVILGKYRRDPVDRPLGGRDNTAEDWIRSFKKENYLDAGYGFLPRYRVLYAVTCLTFAVFMVLLVRLVVGGT